MQQNASFMRLTVVLTISQETIITATSSQYETAHETYLMVVSHLLVTSSREQSPCSSLQAQYTELDSPELSPLEPAPHMSLYSCRRLVAANVIDPSANTQERETSYIQIQCIIERRHHICGECVFIWFCSIKFHHFMQKLAVQIR
jgi:hypothetical protein